jgi:hypothetical protein
MKKSCVALFALTTMSACGGFGSYVACDFREGSLNGKEDRCQERYGISAPTFEQACKASGGKSSSGRCPSTGVVGGCELGTQGDGTKVVDWYYAPMTQANAKKECGNMTFIESYR